MLGKKRALEVKEANRISREWEKVGEREKFPLLSHKIIESRPSESRLVEINGWRFENKINS